MQPNFTTLSSTSNTTPSSNNNHTNCNVNLVKSANESAITTNNIDTIKAGNFVNTSNLSNSSENFKTIKITNLPSRSQSAK